MEPDDEDDREKRSLLNADGEAAPKSTDPEPKESILKRLKRYPLSVFFIVGNEFCERFSYYGMRAVLVLFLHTQLKFDENSSTAMYHGFTMLCYLFPLLGAIISDSCLGKYWTILSLSILYSIGNVIVSVSAIPFFRELNIVLAIVGLVTIAFGTGGIKPCVSAFGGDQFKDEQKDLLKYFFSVFYFSINAGSAISTLLTPVLRNYVHCFGQEECFSLAFGVPAVLMIISIVFFVVGTRFYIVRKPKGKARYLFFHVVGSFVYAIYCRLRYGKKKDKENLMQYATCSVYEKPFLNDVYYVLRVLMMFLPLPIFWALFDQTGSRWTLQAVRMNGQLGSLVVQPDQMQSLNPFLILAFIPLFDFIIYPIFAKCRLLKRPLQRMVVGMMLAGLSFVIAGFVQLKVQDSVHALAGGQAKLVVSNGLPEEVRAWVYTAGGGEVEYHANLSHDSSFFKEWSEDTTNFTLPHELVIQGQDSGIQANYSFFFEEKSVTELVLFQTSTANDIAIEELIYEEELPEGDKASIRVFNGIPMEEGLTVFFCKEECSEPVDEGQAVFNVTQLPFMNFSNASDIPLGHYFYLITTDSGSFNQSAKLPDKFFGGGIYTVNLKLNHSTEDEIGIWTSTTHPPNTVSLFLQAPMYVVLTAGEVMFSISGLEFAYSQAPVSMKAICQAAWLLTVAMGNLFVLIIAEASVFGDQAIEFFFFAICIGVVGVIFAAMSFVYKYVDLSASGPFEDLDKEASSSLIRENGEVFEQVRDLDYHSQDERGEDSDQKTAL